MSCSTSAIAGYGGAVTGLAAATEITNWSIDLTQEILEATSFASNGWREFILGLKGGTGTFTCVGTPPAIGSDTSVVFDTGGPTITGDILVGSITYNTPVDGIVSYDVTFTLCGSISLGT